MNPTPVAQPNTQSRKPTAARTLGVGSLLTFAALLCLVVLQPSCLVTKVGGAFRFHPSELEKRLSKPAAKLLRSAYKGIDGSRLTDHHVHIVGMGTGGTGCTINPELQSLLHPLKRIRYAVYLSACAIDNAAEADQQFVARLMDLTSNMKPSGHFQLLAFDKHYNTDGTVNERKTEFYVPNDYVLSLARKAPKRLHAVASIHPYRHDAIAELERVAKAGVQMIKWLPNAQGIDPMDPKCDPFYAKMKQLGLVLLSHAGEEKAVEAEEDQKLGNPLRLRRALDAGVQVIVAHCASLGEDVDLDAKPGAEGEEPPTKESFDLFLRMMAEKKYEGLLFGEISALVLNNRMGRPLRTMLERQDLHHRLVNGSDYPLPAVNILVRTGLFVDAGYLSEQQAEWLNEIYDVNPLIFDFVLKRTVVHPTKGMHFSPQIFMNHPALFPAL
jgi:uncharacterized protein